MKDTWILPESLCASSGQVVHAFMWGHVFLEAVFLYIVQFVQFSCVIDVNCMIFCYLHISALLMFCILFWICIIYIVSNKFFMYFMWIHTYISTQQIIMQEICIYVNICHDVVIFIWTFWFLMRIVVHVIYLYISHTVTLHLSYFRNINFKKITFHMIFYHTQSTLYLIY